MTNVQHCNTTMEIMKERQTRKRKENSNALRKYVYTKRAQNQIQQNRKVNENKARKGAAKTRKQTSS